MQERRPVLGERGQTERGGQTPARRPQTICRKRSLPRGGWRGIGQGVRHALAPEPGYVALLSTSIGGEGGTSGKGGDRVGLVLPFGPS